MLLDIIVMKILLKTSKNSFSVQEVRGQLIVKFVSIRRKKTFNAVILPGYLLILKMHYADYGTINKVMIQM